MDPRLLTNWVLLCSLGSMSGLRWFSLGHMLIAHLISTSFSPTFPSPSWSQDPQLHFKFLLNLKTLLPVLSKALVSYYQISDYWEAFLWHIDQYNAHVHTSTWSELSVWIHPAPDQPQQLSSLKNSIDHDKLTQFVWVLTVKQRQFLFKCISNITG